jgi:imidazolonepropionase-like amidohydrolase
VDAVKIILSGGGYTPTSNPRSQQYGLETLTAAVTEAHRLGLPVLAHSLTTVSNRNAVAAGVDTVIHGGVWWTEHEIRDRAYDYDPAVAEAMAKDGTWVDPTIGELQLHDEHHAAEGPPKPEFEHWALPDVPSELAPRLEFMRDMLDRGVRFIGGMGMGMPIVTFDTVACSAQVYARLLGIDPWHAIRTITSDAAAALGLAATTGGIRDGLAADFVAVAGDPIADLAALRAPTDVIQAGRPVLRSGRALV